MHDIGKIGIRNEKLNKPGKLTPEEVAMFRSHPAKGKRILEPIPFMRELIPGVLLPPRGLGRLGLSAGLMGDNIPLIGRIVAIADTYDAMTSRPRLPQGAAARGRRAPSSSAARARSSIPSWCRRFIRKIEEHRKQQIAAGNEIPR